MISIDLSKEKNLTFKVTNAGLIKNVYVVLQLPNDVVKRYKGIISENNEIHFTIPVLKDIIQKECDSNYYIEVEDIKGAFHKFSEDILKFVLFPVVELKFHETNSENVNSVSITNTKKEIVVNSKKTQKKTFFDPPSVKPPLKTKMLKI